MKQTGFETFPDVPISGPDRSNATLNWPTVWAIAILPFLGFWLTGLFDLDEGYYGAVTAEMNRLHEWIIPYYHGSPWFEKPILLYWLAKPSIMLFGVDFGPRLPSVLASLATMGIVAWFGRRRLSESTAKLTVLILAGSLLFVAVGRMMLTDPLLVFFLTGAFLTFWESLVGDRRWRLASAVCLGFGVLAKGPVAIALFGLVAASVYWREPALRARFRGYWLLGAGLCVSVMAIWYVPVYLAQPDGFFDEFIVRQNVQRFLGGDAAHFVGLPFGLLYYIPIVIAGLLPWSLWIPWSLNAKGLPAQAATHRFLAIWAIVVFGFFSISGSKLPHYILSAVPPLAMLVATRVGSMNRKRALIGAASWAILMCVMVNLGFWAWYHGWFPGIASQAEAHEMALATVGRRGEIAAYQMSRRDKRLVSGELRVQETSLPSLSLYLGQDIIETDDFDRLARSSANVWIITRSDRIGSGERQAARRYGKKISLVLTGDSGDYDLYLLRSTGPDAIGASR